MKSSILIKTIIFATLFILFTKEVYTQTFDLGVVWSHDDYTTTPSYINNIVKQTDGTYLACSSIIQNNKSVGYIIHFNESGHMLNNYILTPPASAPEWNTGTPTSYLLHAYLTTDNGIIAFGVITNPTAANQLKGHDTNGTSSLLRNGLWVTKVRASDKVVLLNRLDRNNSMLSGSYMINSDRFLFTGFDFDVTNSGKNCFLRVYNGNGDWVYDNYSTANAKQTNISWTANVSDYSSTSLAIAGIDGVYEVKKSDYSLAKATPIITGFTTNDGSKPQGCIPVMTNFGIPHNSFLKKDKGFWVSTRIGYTTPPGRPVQYWGYVMYEKDNTDALKGCKVLYPSNVLHGDGNYSLPILLPGSTTDYVGTRNHYGTKYIYICVDDPIAGFTIYDSPTTYIYNTTLITTSHTDGFFSAGSNNGVAAIAKYSTCVNLKINNLPANNRIDMPFSPTMKLNIPLNYEGAKATTQNDVTYSLTAKVIAGSINGKTAGQTLENIDNQPVSTFIASEGRISGKALDLNRTYTIEGVNAIIEYTLTIHDSYTVGVPPIPQSCNQTYVFRLYSLGSKDVVAMPVARLESGTLKIKTSLKNIGLAAFSSPYKITIYKNNLGNATKYTYSLAQSLNNGQTVDLDIEVPNFSSDSQWAGATTFVVSFNDAGDGIADQPQLEDFLTNSYQISL